MAVAFLSAEWKNLIMANYLVDRSLLLPFLPAGTELDFYNGDAYLSLVGFMFENTRLLGIRIPFHINFEEVNLRFYVRYRDKGEWKRGTVFIKEIVPRHAITMVANNIYHENYQTLPMKHFLLHNREEIELGYHWKFNNNWNRLEATTGAVAAPLVEGSEAAFITEHYWGYSRYDQQTTFEYAVQHPPWNIFPVKQYLVDCDFGAVYGSGFATLQNLAPAVVLVAEGSAIRVLKKKRLRSF